MAYTVIKVRYKNRTHSIAVYNAITNCASKRLYACSHLQCTLELSGQLHNGSMTVAWLSGALTLRP